MGIANVWIQMVKPVMLDHPQVVVLQTMPMGTIVMTIITMETVTGTMVPVAKRHLKSGMNIALIANVWIQMVKPVMLDQPKVEVVQTMPMMTILITITMLTAIGTTVPDAISQ